MGTWTVVTVLAILVIVCAWYLTYTAARLDRLHARVEGSLSALDAQLVRRAEVALEVSVAGELDPASSLLLASAASACLEAAEGAQVASEVQQRGLASTRERLESELTEVLEATTSLWRPRGDVEDELRRRLVDAADRVEIAHRFHNEAVLDVRRVRSKPLVRAFRLAGHTVMPEPVDFDDHIEALTGSSVWR